jgi:hypothetical protein
MEEEVEHKAGPILQSACCKGGRTWGRATVAWALLDRANAIFAAGGVPVEALRASTYRVGGRDLKPNRRKRSQLVDDLVPRTFSKAQCPCVYAGWDPVHLIA